MKKPMAITKIAKQADYNHYILFDDDESELDAEACEELVKEHCRRKNIRITGTKHQEKYLPIIDEKYVFLLSMRGWGSLMAELWSEVDGVQYEYANWAWWMPEGVKETEIEHL
jgi:uncharacterized protein CbrC (UPF0167 family)